jgi:cytochrome c-type biogenesis protein CcmH
MSNRTQSWPPKFAISPIFWAKILQLTLLCAITFVMLGAGKSQFDRLGHELMCSCRCGQILLECNHVGCPSSAGMIDELRAQVATGNSDVQIQNWFVAKYGAIVLAAPMRGGFDNAAWIVPIAVFLLATAGTFLLVWFWTRRAGGPRSNPPGGSLVAVGVPADAALRDRIRRETEY